LSNIANNYTIRNFEGKYWNVIPSLNMFVLPTAAMVAIGTTPKHFL
jgi:hypothetical protein